MSSLPHRRKRLSPWTILWAFVVFCILLTLAPVLLFWIWNAKQAQVVAAQVKAIRGNGEPVFGDEIPQAFPLPAGAQDVTKLWAEGIAALQNPDTELAAKNLPFVGDTWQGKLPLWGEKSSELESCAEYVSANQSAFEKFHEAARLGGQARFVSDYSQGIAMALPAVQSVRLAARNLRLEFEVKSRQRDARGAADAMRALLVLHRAMERDPTVVSHLVRIALDGTGGPALAEKLSLVDFSHEELQEFQSLVASNSPEDGLERALVAERALGYSMLEDLALMGSDRPMTPPLNSDKAAYLSIMDDYIKAIRTKLPKSLDAARQVEKTYSEKASAWSGRWTMAYSGQMLSSVPSALAATARDTAMLRALEAGIAVQRYRRGTNELPDSLQQLIPQYMTAVPLDPYTGADMLYRQTSEGYSIYAVGPIGKNGDEGLFFPTQPK